MLSVSDTRIAVIIATKGRPQSTTQLLRLLERQTLIPSVVLVSATDRKDVEDQPITSLHVEYIFGSAGSSIQRNRALNKIRANCDVVIFFDDDFAPSPYWIDHCRNIFHSEPGVVGISGSLIRDGAQTGGISWDEATSLIDREIPVPVDVPVLSECADLYGCNMAFRMSAIADVNFDERLVLYGWMEDKDFARTVKKRGRIVECNSMVGVHLGLKTGRVSGKRLGYSQIVNPWYLYKKGTLSSKEVWTCILRALVANGLKTFWAKDTIDRRGRLTGNLIGVGHLLSGSCRPERAAKLN